MTSVPFDRVAHEYDETRGGEPRGRVSAAALAPRLRSVDGVVLEVGVGTGLVALGLSHLGRKVVGVDLSEPMLRRAQARGVPVAQGDARRLPVADASVDDVYGVWVLHLVGDIRTAVEEVARVLRPGGRCQFAVTDDGPPQDETERVFKQMWQALRGQRPDAPEAVRRLGEESGLRFVELAVAEGGEFEERPAEIADRIENRTYSVLWDLTDEQWDRHVRPAVEALRAIPDADVPRSKRYRAALLVLEKPEGPEGEPPGPR